MSQFNFKTVCPACGNPKITVNQTTQEIPYFGPIIILTIRCDVCGFKDNSIFPLKTQEPKTFIAKVDGVEDLKIKVIRSNTGFIKIPELGVEIKPGPYSQGFISNVEGLLDRIEEVIKAKMADEKEESKAREFLLRLRDARDGKLPFTVVLKDPLGNSAMVSEVEGKVRVRKMSRREVESLLKG